MSKYAVIICNNGNFTVDSEWNDEQSAKIRFHDKCKLFWNAPDALATKVEIVDDQLNIVGDYKEFIYHEPQEEAPAE